MLSQILISTLALIVLAMTWLFVQRLTYVETPDASGDYLQGRWGCGECSAKDCCLVKKDGGEGN